MDKSTAADSPLIKLTPSSTLTFQLERGSQPKTILKVANTSSCKVVFKVKTTQPTWYFVRPNQQVLNVGQVEEVAIIMVDTECNHYLDQVATRTEEKLDKHRFLVQSRVIEDADYNRILDLPSSQRGDELSKLWDGPKNDNRSVKLKVEFVLPDRTPKADSASRRPAATVSENVENVRSKLSINEPSENYSSVITANPDSIFSELQALRKKYDAVVEYTVHLTAERDAIVAQLESAQRELNREKTKKKTDGSPAAATGKDKGSDKKGTEKAGFSLSVILIIALICFFLGKYLR